VKLESPVLQLHRKMMRSNGVDPPVSPKTSLDPPVEQLDRRTIKSDVSQKEQLARLKSRAYNPARSKKAGGNAVSERTGGRAAAPATSNGSNVAYSLGTYSVPTFKGDDDSTSSSPSRNSRTRQRADGYKSRSSDGGSRLNSSDRSGGLSNSDRSGHRRVVGRGFGNIDDLHYGDDDWEHSPNNSAPRSSRSRSRKKEAHSDETKRHLDSSDRSRGTRDGNPENSDGQRHTLSRSSSKRRGTSDRYSRSRSSGAPSGYVQKHEVGEMPQDDGGGRRKSVGPLNSPGSLHPGVAADNRDPRRMTISQLKDRNVSTKDLIQSRSNRKDEKAAIDSRQPPPQALSNIPLLPTIKSYKVSKKRTDEPAGLFLTKAKNGAVLVHSLSPESLFRATPLHPGQEVLSVNEKRVNDPKMAATLITQAKRALSLRVSTVERSRGFQYCQVKRKNKDKSTPVVDPQNPGSKSTKRSSNAPSHHGVRFVTTSVDGVRRGTITEGLVRVSHIDPHGLFANSHPMNRLRVGGIILTVNGTPVTNGRTALEKVMGSRALIEVLHVDERVWRDDWVKDGLEQVISGLERDPKEITCDLFKRNKEERNGTSSKSGSKDIKEREDVSVVQEEKKQKRIFDDAWSFEWATDRSSVNLRQKSGSCGFKLQFSIDVGTCSPDIIDESVMMPPADEFDVNLLVKVVNDSQRTMMTVLQNMLRRSKFELKFGKQSLASMGNVVRSSSRRRSSRRLGDSVKSDARSDDGLNDLIDILEDNDINDVSELSHDELVGKIPESLLRMDSRDRQRSSLRPSQLAGNVAERTNDLGGGGGRTSAVSAGRRSGLTAPVASSRGALGRRGSVNNMGLSQVSSADIEQWKYETEDQPVSDDKLRNFAARQHRLEERMENNKYPLTSSNSFTGSMFSTDMLEDMLEYLEDVSASGDGGDLHPPADLVGNSGEADGENDQPVCPNSPRDDTNRAVFTPNTPEQYDDPEHDSPSPHKSEEVPINTQAENKDELAYITGVWRDVATKYEISDKVVGSGGFGEVRDCHDKKTRQIYVVKTILKPPQEDTTKVNLIRNEILLLHEAHHPNIVELRDLFEDDRYVHIVMERCTGGDLFDRVVQENPRRFRNQTEAMRHEARTTNSMRSILHVLKYLHSKGIVHRDIKPEHFLLTSNDRETQKIKLIDFGLARKHKPGSAPMTTFTGSPSFVAPEVINRRYNHMCDMFSVGVTAYFLLTGMLPFDGPTDEETFDFISIGRFKFPSSSIFLSDDAKDFVKQLLQVDPKKRMSASAALNHPWMVKSASC